ncbi:hypothetical protein [Kitasatospora kifunensis]|uniref:ATP-binding protein n=1 Tax=Kitasatospora kifunensis TaxID=58351 RepID=A0A7W7R1L3_KITKI|nr:hypothetical protein [Kitasatospora kifunensis]
MSLPLSRRIAQAALLVAAGATPLIAAGSASAAQLVPQGTDLGSGFSKLDGVTKTSTLQGETHQAGQALGTTAAVLGRTAVPAAADAAGMMASTAVPKTDKMVEQLKHQDGSTTAVTGLLTEAADRLTPLVAGSLPGGAATRSMPAMPSSPLSGTGALAAPGSLPAPPTVSGVDKVVNADTVSNPVGATKHLAGQIPATSSLAAAMPSQERLTGALPSSEGLATVLPDTDHALGSVPAAAHLGQHGLTSPEHLTDKPDVTNLVHPTEATDALHLAQLNGQATESAHRLSSLPDLGNVPNLLGGLTGALQHTPSVS